MPEEIKQEVVLKTQKYLGKYVKRPQLSDKLLRKPPFRFLHDIINGVIKETGFLKGLFTDEELTSDNVKEKEAKLAFLSKLIEAVKVVTSTDLAVRPSKIIAGLEPTETNILLQTIGKAIEKKTDSTEYVKQVQSGQISINKPTAKKEKKSSENTDKAKKNKEEKPKNSSKVREKLTTTTNETPKSTDRNKVKRRKETKSKSSVENANSKEKAKREQNVTPKKPEQREHEGTAVKPIESAIITTSEKPLEEEQVVEAGPAENPDVIRKRSASASRPKSARPKSGDIKNKPVLSRQPSALRPPSVRPTSARPGAPRLRPGSGFPLQEVISMGKINVIVENFEKDVDDEETVIIQSSPEIVEEGNVAEVPDDNKGHLVEQILAQISESDGGDPKSGVADNDWQQDVYHGKDSTVRETGNLRAMIQGLTKTANPLGKLLNYLHEDIDAMHVELEAWTSTKKQLFHEIAKQKKMSVEMNKPLVTQLENLTHEIAKIEGEIASTRSNILRNETRIGDLLEK